MMILTKRFENGFVLCPSIKSEQGTNFAIVMTYSLIALTSGGFLKKNVKQLFCSFLK